MAASALRNVPSPHRKNPCAARTSLWLPVGAILQKIKSAVVRVTSPPISPHDFTSLLHS